MHGGRGCLCQYKRAAAEYDPIRDWRSLNLASNVVHDVIISKYNNGLYVTFFRIYPVHSYNLLSLQQESPELYIFLLYFYEKYVDEEIFFRNNRTWKRIKV
jgi:hypothetical protein